MNELKKILIVDDDDAIRDSLYRIIKRLGYEVDSAPDGISAIEKVYQNDYDVVITDIKMPGIDGHKLARMVKKLNDKIAIIMITGYPTVESAVDALKNSAYDYITKPIALNDLQKTLKNVFEKIDLKHQIELKNKEIAKSEKLLRGITDSISDIIYVENKKGEIIYVSPSLERVTGFRKEDLQGDFSNILTSNKMNSRYYNEMKQVLNGGTGKIFISEIKNKRNKKQIMEVSLSPLIENGDIIGTQAVMRDVTDKIKLERKLYKYNRDLEKLVSKKKKELEKSVKKYREFVDNAMEGIFQCSQDGKFLLVNNELVKLLGYKDQSELYKVNFFKSIFANQYDIDKLSSFLDIESRVKGFETVLRVKNGDEVIVNLSVLKVIKQEAPEVLYEGFVEDVTERKRYESKIFQMEKLSSLGRLIAGVAHEIKNPLTGIKMMSHLLLYNNKSNEHPEEMIQDIYNESLKIEKIVKEMLDFSKQKNLALESRDLKAILESCLVIIKKSLKTKNIEIKVDYANNLLPVSVDFRQIEQVFINIMLNSMDAMPGGGILSIKTMAEYGADSAVEDNINNPKKNVVIISDIGAGISKKNISKIYDPFFSTKSHGTGLGLSIANQILQKHNCTIDVESAEGKGATFTIKFPIY